MLQSALTQHTEKAQYFVPGRRLNAHPGLINSNVFMNVTKRNYVNMHPAHLMTVG